MVLRGCLYNERFFFLRWSKSVAEGSVVDFWKVWINGASEAGVIIVFGDL